MIMINYFDHYVTYYYPIIIIILHKKVYTENHSHLLLSFLN